MRRTGAQGETVWHAGEIVTAEHADSKRLQIEARRRRVWQLRISHRATIEEIAEAMEISRGTVCRDLAAMKGRMRKALEQAQKPDAPLGLALEALAELDAATRQTWIDLAASTEGSATRAKFLNAILRAATQRVALLQALGFLPAQEAVLDVMIHRGGREGAAERVKARLLQLARRLIDRHPEELIPVEGSPVTAAVARAVNSWRGEGRREVEGAAEYALVVAILEELGPEFDAVEATNLLRGIRGGRGSSEGH